MIDVTEHIKWNKEYLAKASTPEEKAKYTEYIERLEKKKDGLQHSINEETSWGQVKNFVGDHKVGLSGKSFQAVCDAFGNVLYQSAPLLPVVPFTDLSTKQKRHRLPNTAWLLTPLRTTCL
jgi:hypothetical protein